MEPGMGNDLMAIWGAGNNDIFATGRNGTILHYPNY